MAISFQIPESHIGKPVEFDGVTLKPYRDLDAISGCNDGDSTIAALGAKTRGMQERVLAVSAITPGRAADHTDTAVFSVLQTKLAPRLATGTGCFMMGEKGEDLYMSTREGLMHKLPLQVIGSFGAGITDGLEDRRARLNGLTARHLAVDAALVDLPPGALLIETGAGADYERLTMLRDYALSKGGRLIAHDTVPAAARAVGETIEGIPYLALPHRREFLAKTLEATSGPKVFTLQNVISSMAFGSIDELLTVAGLVDAGKVMVSQSLGIAQATNMLPMGFRAGEMPREMYIIEKLFHDGYIRPGGNEKKGAFIMSLVSLQARHTMEVLLMEIARMYMQTFAAKNSSMPSNRTFIIEQSLDMDPSAVSAWFAQFNPALQVDFEQGEFNTFTTGPFGERCTIESDVPPGFLRLKSMRFTLELSQNPLNAPDFPSQKGQVTRRCEPKDFLTPKEFRKCDPRALYNGSISTLCEEGKSISLEEARRILDLNALLNFGAQLGHKILFDICGRKVENGYITQYQGSKENHMYREFVQN